jgi:hypothetical protein
VTAASTFFGTSKETDIEIAFLIGCVDYPAPLQTAITPQMKPFPVAVKAAVQNPKNKADPIFS